MTRALMAIVLAAGRSRPGGRARVRIRVEASARVELEFDEEVEAGTLIGAT